MNGIILLILAGINSCTMLFVNTTIARVGGKEYDLVELARINEGDIPAECENLTYCTIKPKNYPDEYFQALAREGCMDLAPTLSRTQHNTEYGRADDGFINDCAFNTTYENIYAIRPESAHKWGKVYQLAQDNQQKVRLQTCTNTDTQCFNAVYFTDDIKTKCQQEYSEWEFVVMMQTGILEVMKAVLPVCCSCVYKIE